MAVREKKKGQRSDSSWKPLTNVQIDKILRNRGIANHRGTYSKDIYTLPEKPKDDESLVINLEDYFDGNGTHWVAIYNAPRSPDVEYFDSFGMRSPDVVYQYMLKTGKGIVYNSSMLQDINSVLCGYYCFYFIIHRWEGRPMHDILLDFTQVPSLGNEHRVGGFMWTYI